jgi:imidazoleglycerol-phosphate dehydratase/histidinol-phosphatase
VKKVLFIDRDGTIIVEPEDEQIDSFEKLAFVPGAIVNLARIARELDYELVMVTNQDGLGTDSFPEEHFWPVHNLILSILKGEGIEFSDVLIDRTFPEANAPTRKPGTALLQRFINGNYDLERSFVIGDRASDVQLAQNLGCGAIRIGDGEGSDAALVTGSWEEIYRFLKDKPRCTTVHRKTKETDITITLCLDGSGRADINTGLGFFDHMLAQVAMHGKLDLSIDVQGDLHIDEHHTIEDTALALGEAFYNALGRRVGIERYGFLLPMDETLAQVAIDFGGRPWLVWQVDFQREMIGDVPTEMFEHFFKSFCDTARCTLNVQTEGVNEHHKIEAVFKAWGRAVGMAVSKTGDASLPSTKGVIT